MGYKINTTLCWDCEWACGKDGKCPWATEFKPVPGWNAVPTKFLSSTTARNENGKVIHKRYYVDSFNVRECPLFEFAEAIKKGIVKNAGKRRFKK